MFGVKNHWLNIIECNAIKDDEWIPLKANLNQRNVFYINVPPEQAETFIARLKELIKKRSDNDRTE